MLKRFGRLAAARSSSELGGGVKPEVPALGSARLGLGSGSARRPAPALPARARAPAGAPARAPARVRVRRAAARLRDAPCPRCPRASTSPASQLSASGVAARLGLVCARPAASRPRSEQVLPPPPRSGLPRARLGGPRRLGAGALCRPLSASVRAAATMRSASARASACSASARSVAAAIVAAASSSAPARRACASRAASAACCRCSSSSCSACVSSWRAASRSRLK